MFIIELRRLLYFVTIAEEGTVSKAAQKLNMAQPPLSQQLKILETELGIKLFERLPRQMVLTTEGHFFYNQCRNIIDLVEQAEMSMLSLKDGLQGEIKIGAVLSLGAKYLLPSVEYFRAHYPNVTFKMYEGDPSRITELLEKRIIDLGIVRLPYNQDLFDALQFPAEPLIAVMTSQFQTSSASTVPLASLLNQPLMILKRHQYPTVHSGDLLTTAFETMHEKPTIICESTDVMTLLVWASKGIGIAVVPASVRHLIHHPSLHIQEIVSPSIYAQPAALIWLKNRRLSTVAEQFKLQIERTQKG